MKRPAFLVSLLVVGVFVASSCGPRVQDSATPLRGVPGELTAPTSTSTTTTSTVVPYPTTTLVPTETVVLYFVREETITAVVRDLPVAPEPQQVLDSLLSGYPTSPFGGEVRSAIPRDLEATVTVERGLATIDTGASLLTDISPIDQPLAIAQIVLTLTSRPGIGQVTFLVNGEPRAVPRGGGELAPADQPVAYDDYDMLLGPDLLAGPGQ